jgi:hypothetical protein
MVEYRFLIFTIIEKSHPEGDGCHIGIRWPPRRAHGAIDERQDNQHQLRTGRKKGERQGKRPGNREKKAWNEKSTMPHSQHPEYKGAHGGYQNMELGVAHMNVRWVLGKKFFSCLNI